MWWRFSIHFISAPGTIVCVHYFLNSDKFWKRILLGLGTALCFGNFILNLYPAWQVPLGYMFLAIGIWCLHENWEKVKKLKLRDWMVIAGALALVASFVLSYFLVASEYVEVINATVYPGNGSTRADSSCTNYSTMRRLRFMRIRTWEMQVRRESILTCFQSQR